MDDDLNTADAISAVFDLARDINLALQETHSQEFVANAGKLFDELTGVLGLLYNRKGTGSLDAEIEKLIEERQAARKAKDFKRADEIRDQLKEKGILLKDTPQGVKWSKIES
jgi:cysteinyl-tRNA synthetase